MKLLSRQVREGGYSITYVVVFVAILVAVNWLANQYNKTYDATEAQLYSLSDQTHRILDNLDEDATIYYFDRRPNFNRARSSLVRYENASGDVSVRYVDVDSDLALTESMEVRTLGTTIVEVGSAREEANSTSEEDVTNALIRALKGEEKTACILTGHGEAQQDSTEREGFSVAREEIERANYQIRTISLLENPEMPADCTVAIIAGPDASYLEPEIEILKNYVTGGGRLLVMLDHTKSPELAEMLAGWGIKVNNDLVIDLSGIGQLFGGSPLTPLVAEYAASHPITEVMGNVASFFPMTRSVVRVDPPPNWRVTELMKTTEASFATEKFEVQDGQLVRDPEAETAGPINIAVAATYDAPEASAEGEPEEAEGEEAASEAAPAEDENAQGRVVAVGTSRFARNYFAGRGGNADLLLNMLNWLSSDEDLISIRPKDPESTPFEVSQAGMQRLFWLLVVAMPLVVLAAGMRAWWVRR